MQLVFIAQDLLLLFSGVYYPIRYARVDADRREDLAGDLRARRGARVDPARQGN